MVRTAADCHPLCRPVVPMGVRNLSCMLWTVGSRAVLWLCAGWPSSPSCCRCSTTVYAIGYTLVLFLASLFAGLATASRRVLAHTELISRTAAGTLIIIGVVTFAYGVEQL